MINDELEIKRFNKFFKETFGELGEFKLSLDNIDDVRDEIAEKMENITQDDLDKADKMMEEAMDEIFKENTTYKKTKFGHEINCKKGLWGVCAPTKEQAEKEAKHYFIQYFDDGEYGKDL